MSRRLPPLAAFVRRARPAGGAARARFFEVLNPGSARVDAEIVATVPWLTVAPARLALEPGARGRVFVTLSGAAPAYAGTRPSAVRIRGEAGPMAEIGVQVSDGRPP